MTNDERYERREDRFFIGGPWDRSRHRVSAAITTLTVPVPGVAVREFSGGSPRGQTFSTCVYHLLVDCCLPAVFVAEGTTEWDALRILAPYLPPPTPHPQRMTKHE